MPIWQRSRILLVGIEDLRELAEVQGRLFCWEERQKCTFKENHIHNTNARIKECHLWDHKDYVANSALQYVGNL